MLFNSMLCLQIVYKINYPLDFLQIFDLLVIMVCVCFFLSKCNQLCWLKGSP